MHSTNGDYKSVMLIHQVTGTYLETDNYTCASGEAVQTWNEDPPKMTAGYQGHLWDLIKHDKETYLIRSSQKNSTHDDRMYLEAAEKTKNNGNNAYPRMQKRSSSDLQLWKLIPVSDYPDTYAIQPKSFDNYALGIQNNNCTNYKYVVTNRSWGRPTFHHYWRLNTPPSE